MAEGNRGFAQGLANVPSGPPSSSRLPPRTGILSGRENRLAELATGSAIARVQELVDPAKCRIWEGHNRDYAALDEENCVDLIESFKAQGKQEVPAIVRRVVGDPTYLFEVICGARRHWTASWMRAHDYPDFKFLVEPRELTDEEAFRVADLENRSRRDLSDFERARDYVRAVARYYDGNQRRMAERLKVSKTWLSRYLELAKLPSDVIDAFGSPHHIGISHAATLAPLLRAPTQRRSVIEEAVRLRAEQVERAANNIPFLPAAAVIRRLVPDTKRTRHSPTLDYKVRDANGTILAHGQKASTRGGVTITIPAPGKFTRADLLSAVADILTKIEEISDNDAVR